MASSSGKKTRQATGNPKKERSRRISDGESPKRSARPRAASSCSERDDDEDESGGWSCTVCTYRNPGEAFRCEMCDIRKGTSTRKPRLNSTVVEQQQTVQKFVQQQQAAMMAQANREKKEQAMEKLPSASSSINGGHVGNLSITFGSSPPQTPSSTFSTTSSANGAVGAVGMNLGGYCSPSLSVSPSCSKTPPPLLTAVHCGSGHATPFSPSMCTSPNANCHNLSLQNASSPSPSPSPSLSSIRLLGIGANSSPRKGKSRGSKLVVSSPLARRICKISASAATSKSLIYGSPPISNVDQNSARTLAVTVNGITVVITDYKLRSNNGANHEYVNSEIPGCSHSDAASSPNLDRSRLGNKEFKKRRSTATGNSKKKKKIDSTVYGDGSQLFPDAGDIDGNMQREVDHGCSSVGSKLDEKREDERGKGKTVKAKSKDSVEGSKKNTKRTKSQSTTDHTNGGDSLSR